MQNDNSHGSCASVTRGFAAFWAVLAMGLGLLARPVAAAPFAYVVNNGGTVSVIDTASNKVVATVPVGRAPLWVAITPDGKYAYVTNQGSQSVSVIDTASNMVAVTVLVGSDPFGIAITPDGKHVYVTNLVPNTGSVSVTRPPTRWWLRWSG